MRKGKGGEGEGEVRRRGRKRRKGIKGRDLSEGMHKEHCVCICSQM